jgi:hypothetical protein
MWVLQSEPTSQRESLLTDTGRLGVAHAGCRQRRAEERAFELGTVVLARQAQHQHGRAVAVQMQLP